MSAKFCFQFSEMQKILRFFGHKKVVDLWSFILFSSSFIRCFFYLDGKWQLLLYPLFDAFLVTDNNEQAISPAAARLYSVVMNIIALTHFHFFTTKKSSKKGARKQTIFKFVHNSIFTLMVCPPLLHYLHLIDITSLRNILKTGISKPSTLPGPEQLQIQQHLILIRGLFTGFSCRPFFTL